MSYPNNSTNQDSVQIPQANVEHAKTQHWDELSQVALYLYYLLTNAMKAPPALPAGCLWDEYLGECLLSHLRAEFADIPWPGAWSDLKPEDISKEMIDKLHFVARRRTFLGACAICESWYHVPDDPPLATRDIIEGFLEAKRGAIAEGSLTSYRHTLQIFAKYYPVLPTEPEELEKYFARFKERCSAASAYRVLKLLYNFASERHGVPNVMKVVTRPRFKEKEPLALSLVEADAVHSACRDDRELGLIHLYLDHGWRLEEGCRANVGDIGDGQMLVRGKVRDEYVPLLPETEGLLLKLADGRSPDEPLFLSQHKKRLCHKQTYNIVKAILNRAGVTNGRARVATHTLRKTFATLAHNNGCDGRVVERLLRHRKGDVTSLYISIPMDVLKRNLERYSPIRLLNNQVKPGQELHKTEYRGQAFRRGLCSSQGYAGECPIKGISR